MRNFSEFCEKIKYRFKSFIRSFIHHQEDGPEITENDILESINNRRINIECFVKLAEVFSSAYILNIDLELQGVSIQKHPHDIMKRDFIRERGTGMVVSICKNRIDELNHVVEEFVTTRINVIGIDNNLWTIDIRTKATVTDIENSPRDLVNICTYLAKSFIDGNPRFVEYFHGFPTISPEFVNDKAYSNDKYREETKTYIH